MFYFAIAAQEERFFFQFVADQAVGICVNIDETPMKLTIGGFGGRF